MNFRAAVLHQVDQPLRIEQVAATDLKPTDVLIRNHASGLCHTDLEVIQGSLAYPLPIILGHEGAGVVEAVGADVTQVRAGDHVIASWNPHCGHCFYCDQDQPILCEPFGAHQPQGRLLDGTSRLSLGDGPLHHFSMVCSHAEYSIVPESGAIPVPRDIPFDRACLIGCGVMTGVGGVLNVARAEVGESVAVIGCGAVGLNAIQGARLARAEPIIAIDTSAEKLALAETFGATDLIDAGQSEVIPAVQSLTRGRGADNVIECGGNEAAFRLAFEIARPGADVVLLGKTNVDSDVAFRWGSMMGEKRMTRSSYGRARPRQHFPMLARLYLGGELLLDELISQRLTLDRINDGFADMAAGRIVRAVVEMG